MSIKLPDELFERVRTGIQEADLYIGKLEAENERLRERCEAYKGQVRDGALVIERLRLWIRRIDNINDDPARFSTEIDQACMDALAGKPMVGVITVDQQQASSPQDSKG